MIMVIKEEFEKLESLKIGDGSFACDSSLEIFHEEFNRMIRMDDDLFTYEVEISSLANIPYSNDEDEVAEIFRIDTNVFDFETPTCKAFKEFNFFYESIQISLLKILMNLRLTKNIRMIGFMSEIMTYHGYMKNHGPIMEYRKNPLLWNIIVNHSHLKMDIRNSQLVAGKMTDIVTEGTCLELT
ncbi:hypothetical protein Tco_1236749 [Tanacetum coccineum]